MVLFAGAAMAGGCFEVGVFGLGYLGRVVGCGIGCYVLVFFVKTRKGWRCVECSEEVKGKEGSPYSLLSHILSTWPTSSTVPTPSEACMAWWGTIAVTRLGESKSPSYTHTTGARRPR